MSDTRYAIYFVPGADTPLYRFGASVLGYDGHTARQIPFIADTDASWPEIIRDPRVYGFHATLKAPFYLADGRSEIGLREAADAFAADRPAVFGGPLTVRPLGSFIALVPTETSAALNRLADSCVRAFEPFRAPLRPEDRARRLGGLSPLQTEYLDHWGYPYVFEEFRFHMTLSGTLTSPLQNRVVDFLRTKFAQVPSAHALRVDRVVIARQAQKSAPFQVIHEALLGQSALRPYAYSF